MAALMHQTRSEHSTGASTSSVVVDRLRRAGELLDDLDLSSVDGTALAAVTRELRRLESRCAGVAVDIARRSRRLGGDPDATLLGEGKVSGRNARKEAKRADVADRMAHLGEKLRNGEVSGEHLDAIANASADLSDEEAARLAALDRDLADAAAKQPVDTFRRHLRRAVDECRGDHGEERLARQRARSTLKMWTDNDGMGHLHATGDPERFAKIQTAIERETARLAATAKKAGESVTLGPVLQFDALVQLIEGVQGAPARPSIIVVVDHRTLVSGPHEKSVCETTSGVPLPISVVERYICDGLVRVVTLSDTGLPLDVGRTYRTATPAQWAAIKAMWRTCIWHGCDVSVDWCQAHHIHEWEHGGPTDLKNLAPLCSKHHHMAHEGGWRLVMRADGTIEIHRPIGSSIAASAAAEGSGPRSSAEIVHMTASGIGDDPRHRPGEATLWATVKPDRFPHPDGSAPPPP